MVHVRFLSPCCTNGPASTTNTLLQSCDCPHLFSTDFFGSSPIRVVPPSWMILPGASNPYDVSGPGIDPDTTAPISWSISRNVSCRSEEHTSELQSLMRISYAVFCLKNKNTNNP